MSREASQEQVTKAAGEVAPVELVSLHRPGEVPFLDRTKARLDGLFSDLPHREHEADSIQAVIDLVPTLNPEARVFLLADHAAPFSSEAHPLQDPALRKVLLRSTLLQFTGNGVEVVPLEARSVAMPPELQWFWDRTEQADPFVAPDHLAYLASFLCAHFRDGARVAFSAPSGLNGLWVKRMTDLIDPAFVDRVIIEGHYPDSV